MAVSCGTIRKAVSSPLPQTAQTPSEKDDNKPIAIESKTDSTVIGVVPVVEVQPLSLSKEDKSSQRTLLRIARSKLGSRYSYGSKGPNSFDCSGFTGYVFMQLGISLGASSRDQFLQGRPVGKGEPLRPGDLVFWNGRSIGNTIGHVGIVVDYDNATDTFTFIHAAVSTGVELQKSTAEYYARRYMGARRILDDIPADSPEDEEIQEERDDKIAEAPSEQPEPVYHTIKSGDTLSALAVKYHTSVSKICSLNGISSKTILKIGRRLKVK